MDRRLTPFSGRVALAHLRGQVAAEAFVDGTPAVLCRPVTDLCRNPGGARDRQLLWGDEVTVIDRQGEEVFVQARKDGYCGWLAAAALSPPGPAATHRVAAPASHLYPEPRVQAPEIGPLPLNARLAVTEIRAGWAATPAGFVPAAHLRALDTPAPDPVAVAESLLGAPYLWGGNSAAGIDCSGLVQAAFHAAGTQMPGDSDLQATTGDALPDDAGLRRGDLLFWKGHVALVADGDRLIHANGHSMSVALEGIQACMERIAASGDGPVTARRRV